MLIKIRKNILINIGNSCFYFFWITLLVGKGWGYSSADDKFVGILLCTAPFILIKMALTNWNKAEFLWCIFLNFLGVVVWKCSGKADILLTMIAITACKDIRLSEIFKLTLIIKGGLFVLKSALAIFGIIENTTKSRMDLGLHTFRYGLGYGNPNIAHYTFMIVIMLVLLLYHRKMKLIHYAILLVYNIYIFSYTDSRTAVTVVALCIILAYLLDKKKAIYFQNILCFVGQYAYFFALMLSLFIVLLFEKITFLRTLNTMSARFSTGHSIVTKNKLSLFGLPNLNSDLGYITTLYGSGVLVFALFIIGMTLLMIRLKKRHKYIEILLFSMIAGYHIMSNYNDSIAMNPLLLYVVIVLFPRSADMALQ